MDLEVSENFEEASSSGSPAGVPLWIEGELCDSSCGHVSAQFPFDESVDGQGKVGEKQKGVDATNAMQIGGGDLESVLQQVVAFFQLWLMAVIGSIDLPG